MPARPGLGSAKGVTLAAAALVAGALVLRMAVKTPGEPSGLDRFVPVLLGAAGLCGAGLALRRAPAVAWLCALAAAGIAALEILGVVRAWQPFAPIDVWPRLVGIADAALVAAALIAALEATRPRAGLTGGRWPRLVGLGAIVGVGGVISLGLWALATALGDATRPLATPDLWPIRWTGRVGLGLVVAGVTTGVAADLAGPVVRARERLAASTLGASASARAGSPGVSAFLRLLADELVPSISLQRRRAADDERARLAADLHARVLPDLRRAAAAAAGPGVPASVSADVRGALAEVEQLMEGRQSMVLESFGLVAALEWLAERTEDQTPVRVEVQLDGELVSDPEAVPLDVRRAIFRIALLAVDNIERHASAARATLRLRVDPGFVSLAIVDDGRGMAGQGSGSPARAGRGLADMRAEARAVGASLSVSSGAGTTIDVAWPGRAVRGEHATVDAHTTARRTTSED